MGLDPVRGHSKLNYLSYSVFLMQFFDIRGGTKIVGEGLGVGHICFGCAQEIYQAMFSGGTSLDLGTLHPLIILVCYSWGRTFHN